MIDAVNLSHLPNRAYSQYAQDLIDAIVKGDPKKLDVEDELEEMKKKALLFDENFKKSTASPVTEEVLALDRRRDDAFIGFSTVVRGYTFSKFPEKKKGANAIISHLGIYGSGIASDVLQYESATLRNIVKDLQDIKELKEAVDILGQLEWVTEIEESNNLFIDAYRERADEKGNASTDTLRTLREEAYPTYYALRDRLNAFFILTKGAEPYATVINNINGRIFFYNKQLENKGGKSGNSGEEKPADTPPTPPTN